MTTRAITPAIAGLARAGVTRSGYYGPNPALVLTVAGVSRSNAFDRATWRINRRPSGQANTLHLEVFGFTPEVGDEVVFGHASITNRLFTGKLTTVRKVHNRLNEGRIVWACECVDWTYELASVLVTAKYTSQSATTIAQTLVALASGFTSTNVQAGLATLDDIQFTMVPLPSALQQLADRIGAYWYVDFDRDVHLFTSESGTAQTVNTDNRHVRQLEYREDIDGLRNEILVEGIGSTVRAAVAAGSTTIPLDDASMFAPSGTNHAKLEAQRITYTGTAGTNGTGSTAAGKTTSVPSAPAAANSGTAGKLVGRYFYKTAFVINGGETAASAASSQVTVGVAEPDGSGVTFLSATGGSIAAGTFVRYKFTFLNAFGETTAGPPSNGFTVVAGDNAVAVIGIPTGPAGTTNRYVYRSDNGAEYGAVRDIADNVTTSINDGNNVIGVAPPGTNTAGGGQASVSSIALGPTGTTARRLYRTVAGGSIYKRVTTINDNSTTTFTDNVPDGSLGDEALTASTVPTNVGDTTLPVVDLAVFPSSGWVNVGSQHLRYTGRSAASGAGTLTGIPSSGVGSIQAPVPFNAKVINAPHLTGVPASGDGAITHALVVGEGINVLIVSEDLTSQGTYGVRSHFIQDRRLSRDGCAERGAAYLALSKDPRITGSMLSTDPVAAQTGKPLTVDVAEWGISVTVTIQDVSIASNPWPNPIAQVSFSSRSAEDLFVALREIKERQLIR